MPIQEVGDAPMSVNGVGDFLDVMTELMVNLGRVKDRSTNEIVISVSIQQLYMMVAR